MTGNGASRATCLRHGMRREASSLGPVMGTGEDEALISTLWDKAAMARPPNDGATRERWALAEVSRFSSLRLALIRFVSGVVATFDDILSAFEGAIWRACREVGDHG
jgi:hypothetical protein